MTRLEIALIVVVIVQYLLGRHRRNYARFMQNHCEHWKRMYDEKVYGVPYKMPANFNTEENPFKIEFEPQDWGAARK
jgi:hypothetical protein